jgi:hypothetical protein
MLSAAAFLAASPAAGTPPPPAGADGLAAARAFVGDLALGLNIERGQAILNGWITAAQLRDYKAQGATHVRFFVPAHPSDPDRLGLPDAAAGRLDWFFDAVERAMGAGLKVLVDLLDVMSEADMADPRVVPYLRACGRRIAARGWDPARYAVGAANEYAAGSNAGHRQKRLEALRTLRGELPRSLLLSAAARWGSPWAMLEDSYDPGADAWVLHQWHHYDERAWDVAVCRGIQDRVAAWARRRNVVTICGEWGVGPPDNATGAAQRYGEFPRHIDAAARGMGRQRPTLWAVTAGRWWRLNVDGDAPSGALRPEVAAAVTAASAHIARQPWFRPAASSGGGRGATTRPPEPDRKRQP